MKKLFLIGTMLCVLCFCASASGDSNKSNVHEDHEWVDLGLPSGLKWATCNVGAVNPEDNGEYFSWGETSSKYEYLSGNSLANGQSWGDIGGDSSRDAATAKWGGNWRMPTEAEFQELKDNCIWTWTVQKGKRGYKVTSKKNNQSIFLPATGHRAGDKHHYDDDAFYWSSTPYKNSANNSCFLYFFNGGRDVMYASSHYGLAVRPVMVDSGSQPANVQSANLHEGHEWVDLGMPSGLKWATCNVGASTMSDYGDYYAWGETGTKSTYSSDNCLANGKSWGDIGGDSSRDAARANWGGSWRMPTKAEFQELKDNCTWIWTAQNGHVGYKITGPNGNSIFLPAAGYRDEGALKCGGEYGYYFSSTPDDRYPDSAIALRIDETETFGRDIGPFGFECGRSVRPVLAE